VSHNNNKHTNSADQFPGDFANFQTISSISRRKNNSSRFPGVLDTRHLHNNEKEHNSNQLTSDHVSVIFLRTNSDRRAVAVQSRLQKCTIDVLTLYINNDTRCFRKKHRLILLAI